MPSIINATTSTGLVSSADNSGSLQLATNNGTTAVTIDTSQNVGIGLSPGGRLDIAQVSRVRWDLSNAYVYQSVINVAGNTYQRNIVDALQHEFYSSGTERMRIASDGTISTTIGSTLYGAYPARAWVNFNGTGTPAIRNSRNVSSITDNGTGDYTVNFTTAMPDNEYAVVYGGATDWRTIGADGQANITTSGVRLLTRIPSNANASEVDSVALAVFR